MRVKAPAAIAGIKSLRKRSGRGASSACHATAVPVIRTAGTSRSATDHGAGDPIAEGQPDDVIIDVQSDRAVPPPRRQTELGICVARLSQLVRCPHVIPRSR